MKFRVSSRDFIIFVAFCILLLYLCAIGVLNLASFGNNGTFAGLNPFPAFTSKYIGVTFLLFFIFLIMIFTSVSSYIFDREKGKGIGLKIEDKKEKGYSRWAKEKEIKEDRNVELVDLTKNTGGVAGIPLMNNGKQIYVDNGEYHSLVIGSSGSGKSECIVKPMVNLLARNNESMIITDPKGELYRSSAEYLKKQGYKVIVLNFREPQKGNAWNPLYLPYQYMKMGNVDKATELLDDVASNILYDPSNKDGAFWEKSAADYFSGLALGLFQDAKPEEINLNSISVMSTVGEERFGPSDYIREYFKSKGEASSAYIFASNTINAPTDTKGGIVSTFRQKIRLFASRENLSEMLSYSDFDMLKIGKEKTAIFIIIHDEKTTYHGLATIFIKQCYETLIDVAQENGGKLPFRTNFILDEFANMPPLQDVDAMVTAARSRKIRFTFIIQNFAQLNDVYGKEVAEVIRGNCGNMIYLISTELAALEEISKMCGEVKSGEKDKTASTPLVTVTDLQKMKMFEAIIKRLRLDPFRTQYTPNFEMDWGIAKFDSPFPNREVKKVEIFDLKAYVKEKQKEKMQSGLNNSKFNSFNNSPMFDSPFSNMNKSNNSLFNNNFDLDAMMKDIDRKIAELDEEEKKNKNLKTNESNEIIKDNVKIDKDPLNSNNDINPNQNIDSLKNTISDNDIKKNANSVMANMTEADLVNRLINDDNQSKEVVKKEPLKEQEKEKSEKLKVNVDADSVIVDDHIVTDDEYFDDFFNDDDL